MQIFIKTLKGKTIVLDIEEWHTIKDIKTMIQDRDGIPFEAIRLANLGRTLSDDNKTIKDYNISYFFFFYLNFLWFFFSFSKK